LSPELPERLRLETRELHSATERSGAMAALLGGRMSRAGYCAMLRNLHAIYAALETALLHRQTDAVVAQVNAPALHREAALSADLHDLQGPHWPEELTLQPATQAYVQRLQELAAGGSPALVAHAYVRYLGDLHGGQVLKRLVVRNLGLAGEAGTRFYEFGAEAQVLSLRTALRVGLASLPVSVAEQDAIVAEARWAFTQHQLIFEQLPV
jgi:heme oxygenase